MADQPSDQEPSTAQRSLELLAELRQFTGDLQRWRHPLNRNLIFTAGVKHLAERAECFWLIDAVASWVGSKEFVAASRRDPRIGEIHFWKLVVASDRSAVLTAVADSGEPPFIRQAIEFTDLPLTEISLYCANDGTNWTVMLTNEY